MRALRNERGQTAAEYVGIILVVAAIIAAIGASGIAEALTARIQQSIAQMATGQGGEAGGGGSGGSQSGGGGSGPGGGGSGGSQSGGGGSGPGGTPGGSSGPGGGPPPEGGPGDPGAGQPGERGPSSADPARPGAPGPGEQPPPRGRQQPEDAPYPCGSVPAGGICAYGAATTTAQKLAESRSKQALQGVDDATKALLGSGARPGSAKFERLVKEREAAVVRRQQAVTRERRLKLTNPSVQALREEVARRLRGGRPAVRPSTPKGAAAKVASGAGKAGKFLAKKVPVIGTPLALKANTDRSGGEKGTFETAAQLGGTALFVGAVGVACAATAGVGCAVAAAGAAIVGSEFGRRAGSFAYDNLGGKQAIAGVKNGVKGAASAVASEAGKVAGAAKDVADKLLPDVDLPGPF